MPNEPVTVQDNKLVSGKVQVNEGHQTITFQRTPPTAMWKFTDISIWADGATEPGKGSIASPFSGKSVADDAITVVDDNPKDGKVEKFHYRLFGEDANGNPIQGDPEIVNRGV